MEAACQEAVRVEEVGLFGARRRVEDLQVEVARLQGLLTELGGLDDLAREQRRQQAEQRLAQVLAEEQAARVRVGKAELELRAAQADLVQTDEQRLLQAAGVYEYARPLQDAVAYKAEIARLKQETKNAITSRRAVSAASSWHVNGSLKEGQKMVKDFSTLMLRAYNAEADNCVRTVKPHTLRSTLDRLQKTQQAIAKLGRTMSISITPAYHGLRCREIELAADYLAKLEEEKERIRAQRERDREEEAARKEFEREKSRLLKEQAHYTAAYDKLLAQGKTQEAAEFAAKLNEIGEAITGVEARAANSRAGYVYVISNIGSFGEEVVKVGMTPQARTDGPSPGARGRLRPVPLRRARPCLQR